MFRLILIAFCLAASVLSYPQGASKDVCSNGLTPGHDAEPQTSESPYSFSGENSVKSGEKIKITLSGKEFLGYVLQAQDINGLSPGHDAEPQTSEAPYSFSGENSVKSGEKIKITLSGKEFLGYVLQAQDTNEKPVGTFKILEANKSKLLSCSADGDTLIHVQLDNKPIQSVEFEWLAPAEYKGNVQFVATVVKDYVTFWERKVTKDVAVE